MPFLLSQRKADDTSRRAVTEEYRRNKDPVWNQGERNWRSIEASK